MQIINTGVSWLEVFLLLLVGNGFWGMPLGERDAELIQLAPQNSLVYFEWAGRAKQAEKPSPPLENGIASARGIEGLTLDPEVAFFVQAVRKALSNIKETDVGEDGEASVTTSRLITIKKLAPLFEQLTRNPGCLFVGYESPPQPGNLLGLLKPNEILKHLRVGLASTSGSETKELLKTISQLAEVELDDNPQLVEITAGPFALKLIVHREGDRVLIGFGDGTVSHALAGLKGEASSLNVNPGFQTAWKKVATRRTVSVTWIDVRGAVNTIVKSAGPMGFVLQAVIRGTGIDAIDSAITSTGITQNGDLLQRTFLNTGGRASHMLGLFSGPSLRVEQLRHIPADCDIVMAASLNLPQFFRGVKDLVGKTTPGSAAVFDEAVKELETELQLSLEKDIYPALGDVISLFNSRAEGGFVGSCLTVAIEVRDARRAETVFERMMKLVAQSVAFEFEEDYEGQRIELKQQSFLGTNIHYMNTIGWSLGPDSPTSPSFCLTPTHALFALHPQALKAHLRWMNQSADKSERESPQELNGLDGDALFYARLDGARAGQIVCAVLPFFSQSVLGHLQANNLPLDIFAVPSAAALLPYFDNSTFVLSRQNDGLLLDARNPHISIGTFALLTALKQWYYPEYSDEFSEDVARRAGSKANPTLGDAEGRVTQAAAETEKDLKPLPAKTEGRTGAFVSRKLGTLILKSLIPDDVQQLVPNEAFKKLEEPPSAETLQKREDRRKQLEERRRQRLKSRLLPSTNEE